MANAKIARKLKLTGGNQRVKSPLDYKTQFLRGISAKSMPTTQINAKTSLGTNNPNTIIQRVASGTSL